MRYSEDIIEQVRTGNDIVKVIEQVVPLKRSGRGYMGICPFHNEKTGSFHVDPARQMYYCFGCHAGGNVLTFRMSYYQESFVEALQALAGNAGITLPEADDSKEAREAADKKTRLFEINKQAANFYYAQLRQKTGENGLRYLKGRKLTDETLKKFALGYADQFGHSLYQYLKKKGYGDGLLEESGLFVFREKGGFSDKFWNRVMFPIQDVSGRVIGFGGRVMGDGKPKYLNSPETTLFNKRRHLYGLNFARLARERYLILCEGYMDVITMHQAGISCAVASLGTALTPEQANLIKRYAKEVRLLYDSDGAGVNAALRAIPILREAGLEARVVNLSPAKDPDEFINAQGPDALRKRIEDAEADVLFEIRQMSLSYQMSDPQDKTRFCLEAAGRLAGLEDELERENYLKTVSRLYNIDENALRRLVNKIGLRGMPAENYKRPKKAAERREKEEDGLVFSEKMMLTYLSLYPEAFTETKGLIDPEDFTDPLCHEIAVMLYRQHEAGKIEEAALLDHFTDPEAQRQIAGFFNAKVLVQDAAGQDRAFTDTVQRLMAHSTDTRIKKWDGHDVTVLTELMDRKKRLEEMQRSGRIFHLPFRADEK